ALDTRPHYLTWFGPSFLEGTLAQGALTLAGVSSRASHRLLDDADTALSRTATDPASTPRRAVFSAALLSRPHLPPDNLHRAAPPAAPPPPPPLPPAPPPPPPLTPHPLKDALPAPPPPRRPAAVRSLHDQLRSWSSAARLQDRSGAVRARSPFVVKVRQITRS